MTVYNLTRILPWYSWDEVEETLFRLYPDEKHSIEGYKKAFIELKYHTVPTSSDMTVHIETVEDGESTYEDVHAYKSGEDTVYAIDFIPWSEVLSMSIANEVFLNYTELEILCHILWEITFHGDSAESVAEKFSELQSRKEEMLRQLGEAE